MGPGLSSPWAAGPGALAAVGWLCGALATLVGITCGSPGTGVLLIGIVRSQWFF